MNTVFVSYSKQDKAHKDEVEKWLKPLEKEGLCELFIDVNNLEPGRKWSPDIQAALEKSVAAVLIITQNFITSSYISNKEMPRLLAKEKRDELKIYPLFYKISTIDTQAYFSHDDSTKSQKIIVTDYQGFASPHQPMTELSKGKQDKQLKALADLLRKKLQPLKQANIGLHSTNTIPTQTLASFNALTIELNIHDQQLHRRVKTDQGQDLSHSTDNWLEIKQALQALPSLQDASSTKKQLRKTALAWGSLLYRILFGDEQISAPLFFTLTGGRNTTPIFKGYPVFILSFDQELRTLPWQLTAWKQYFLSDKRHLWRFTVAPVLANHEQISRYQRLQFSAAGHSLIIVPDNPQGTQCAQLFQAVLQEKLYQSLSNRIHIVKTADDLETFIARTDIQLLIYYGDFSLSEPHVELFDCADFIRQQSSLLWSAIIVQEGFAPDSEDISDVIEEAQQHLSVESLYTQAPKDSHTLNMLAQWLSQDKPLLSLQHDYIRKHLRKCLRTQTFLLVNGKTEIRHTAKIRIIDPQEVRLKFDRFALKTVLLGELVSLHANDDLQTLMIIQGGYKNDQLKHLDKQLQKPVRQKLPNLIILREKFQIPDDRSNLRFSLEQNFRQQFELFYQTHQTLLNLRSPKKRVLIWLDWGVYGDDINEEHPSLNKHELQDWLDFMRDYVPLALQGKTAKPPLLLNLLCLNVEIEAHQQAEQQLLHVRGQAEYDDLHFMEPQNLRNISRREVITFFSEYSKDLVSSHIATRNKIAQIIAKRANGRFTHAVQLLEELAKIGERAFLAKYP